MERNDFIGQKGGADSPGNKGNKSNNKGGNNKGEKKVMATAFNIIPSLPKFPIINK